MVFLYMEKCCGSCCLSVACCNIQDQVGVFDPEQEDVQDQDGVKMEEAQMKDGKDTSIDFSHQFTLFVNRVSNRFLSAFQFLRLC